MILEDEVAELVPSAAAIAAPAKHAVSHLTPTARLFSSVPRGHCMPTSSLLRTDFLVPTLALADLVIASHTLCFIYETGLASSVAEQVGFILHLLSVALSCGRTQVCRARVLPHKRQWVQH